MDNFIVAAELRIFILEGMKTVRACCDNFFHGVPVQRLDVPSHQCLSEILVSHPTRSIAVALFFKAKNGERHACRPQNLDHGERDLFDAVVERAGTADPEQNINVAAIRHARNIHSLSPIAAGGMAETPWREVTLKIIKR